MALRIDDKWYKTKGQAAEILDVSEYSITQRIKAEDTVEILTLDEVEELELEAGFDEDEDEEVVEETFVEPETVEPEEAPEEGTPIIVVEEAVIVVEETPETEEKVKKPKKERPDHGNRSKPNPRLSLLERIEQAMREQEQNQ